MDNPEGVGYDSTGCNPVKREINGKSLSEDIRLGVPA